MPGLCTHTQACAIVVVRAGPLNVQRFDRLPHPRVGGTPVDTGVVDIQLDLVVVRIVQVQTLTHGVICQSTDGVSRCLQTLPYPAQVIQGIADFPSYVIEPDSPSLQWAGGITHLYQQQFVVCPPTAKHRRTAVEK